MNITKISNKKDDIIPKSNKISIQSIFADNKIWFLMILINLGFITFLSLSIPDYTSKFINIFSKKDDGDFNAKITVIALLVVFVFVFESLQVYISAKLRENIGSQVRSKLINKVVDLNYTEVNDFGTGQAITLFGSDVETIKNTMAGDIVLSIKALMLFIGAIVFLLIANWQIALIAVCSIPIIMYAFFLIFKKVVKYFSMSQVIQSKLNSTISQNIFAHNLIRVQNSQGWENNKFSQDITESQSISFKIIGAFSTLIPIINTIAGISGFVILYFSGVLFLANQIKLGDINSYLSYYALLIAPIFIIGFNSQAIARIITSLKRVNSYLSSGTVNNLEEKKINDNETVVSPELIDKIVFNNVCLSFKTKSEDGSTVDKEVLKDISFTIKAGQSSAILGPTGGGKSLIVSLATSLLKPTSGSITINDVATTNEQVSSLVKNIATVYQESLIFNDTLEYNILLGRKYDKEQLELAIQTAEINELFGVGHDSEASELGGNLSGGQKQRLTLARALYGNPEILLLDDFVARIDSNTRDKIFDNLARNYPNITTLIVTQSIDTIKNCDNIVVIMEGELIAQGTHLELLENSDDYQIIFNSQKLA